MSPYQVQMEEAYNKLMSRLQNTTKVTLPRIDIDDLPHGDLSTPGTAFGVGHDALTYAPIPNDDDDASPLLDSTPCPPTMRELLRWVHQSIAERLSIAEISTVKQCMRLIFECRSFLERFLKDIPTMGFFREHDPANRAAGVRRMGLEVDELLYEFKKVPLALPRAIYREQANGKYVPHLEPVQTANTHRPRPSPRERPLPDASLSHSFSMSGSGCSSGLGMRVNRAPRYVVSIETAAQTEHSLLTLHPQATIDALKDDVNRADQLRWEAIRRAKTLESELEAAKAVIASHEAVVDEVRRKLYHEVKHLRSQLAATNASSPMAILGSRVSLTSNMFGRRVSDVPRWASPGVGSNGDAAVLATSADLEAAIDGIQNDAAPVEDYQAQLWEERGRRREEYAWRVRCEALLRKRESELNVLLNTLRADPVRVVISSELSSIKRDFQTMRAHVVSSIRGLSKFLATSIEVARNRLDFREVDPASTLQRVDAVEDLTATFAGLIVPMFHEEFAKGQHPWPYQRNPEPMLAYAMATYPAHIVPQLQKVLQYLHIIYLYTLRFSLQRYYLPDHRNPQYGRGLVRMVELALVNPQCTPDVARSLLEALAIDRSLAKKQVRINFHIKAALYEQQRRTVATNIGATVTHALRNKHLNDLRSQRLALINLRTDTARRAFRVWSHSDIPMPLNSQTRDPYTVDAVLERYVGQSKLVIVPPPSTTVPSILSSNKGGTTSDQPPHHMPFVSLSR